MTLIGYHASHEQFAPSELRDLVVLAEKGGFHAAKSSDHFHPWNERQGQSGFAWSWLGATMQATSLPFGIISAPGYRYHPAVLAQAATTCGEMFPDRLWLALGSGEAINESITGRGLAREGGTKRPARRVRRGYQSTLRGPDHDPSWARHYRGGQTLLKTALTFNFGRRSNAGDRGICGPLGGRFADDHRRRRRNDM